MQRRVAANVRRVNVGAAAQQSRGDMNAVPLTSQVKRSPALSLSLRVHQSPFGQEQAREGQAVGQSRDVQRGDTCNGWEAI